MSPAASRRSVVILESDELLGSAACGFLRHADYETKWVATGEAALAEVCRRAVGLVIANTAEVGHPNPHWGARLRRLSPETRFVLVWRHQPPACWAGADAELQQPYTRFDLLVRVRWMCGPTPQSDAVLAEELRSSGERTVRFSAPLVSAMRGGREESPV